MFMLLHQNLQKKIRFYKKKILRRKKYVKIVYNRKINLLNYKQNSNYYFTIYLKYKYGKKFKISKTQYLRNKTRFLIKKKNSILRIRLSYKRKKLIKKNFLKKRINVKNINLQTFKRKRLIRFIRKKKRKFFLYTNLKRCLIYKIIKRKVIQFKYRKKRFKLRRIYLNKYLIKKIVPTISENFGVSELGFINKIKLITSKFKRKNNLFLKKKKKSLILNKIFIKNTILISLKYLRNARLFNYIQRRYLRIKKRGKKKEKNKIFFCNLKKFNYLINSKKREIQKLKKQTKLRKIYIKQYKRLKKQRKKLFNYFFNLKKLINILNLKNYTFKKITANKSNLRKSLKKRRYFRGKRRGRYYYQRLLIINNVLKYKKYFNKLHFNFKNKGIKKYARILAYKRRSFQIKIRNLKLITYKKKINTIKVKLKLKEFFIKIYTKQFNTLLKKTIVFNNVLIKKKINIGLMFEKYNKKLKLLTHVKKLKIFNFLILIRFLKMIELFPIFIKNLRQNFKDMIILCGFNLSFLVNKLKFNNINTNFNLKMINFILNCKWLKKKLYTRLKKKLLNKTEKFKIVNGNTNSKLILPRIQYKFIEMKSYFKIYRKLRKRLNEKGRKTKAMYLLFNKLSEIFIYKIRKLKSNKQYLSIKKKELPKVGLFMLKYLKRNMFITLLYKTTNKVLGSTSARKTYVEQKNIEQEEALLKNPMTASIDSFNVKVNAGKSIKNPYYRVNVLINLLEAVKNFGYGIIDLQLKIKYKKRFLLRLLRFSTVQYVGFIRLIQIASQKSHGFLRKKKRRRI